MTIIYQDALGIITEEVNAEEGFLFADGFVYYFTPDNEDRRVPTTVVSIGK